MSKIIIINTGGTISMAVDPTSGTVKPQSVHPLHQIRPYLKPYGEIEMEDFLNLPSPHMTPELMLQIANRIEHILHQENVRGVVVTHGTDTLEETSYLLDLVIPSSKPIVVTGAMRSSNELGADGPINLVNSIRTIAEEQSNNRGVLVVFNDEIHAARYVTKTHTSHVGAFQSPQHGPIGFITKKKVHYLEAPIPRRTFLIQRIDRDIPLIKVVAGMKAEWISFLLEDSIDGVVIEAFGAGNVSPSIMPIIKQLCDQNKPVVLVSRSHSGFVEDLYGYEGGGSQLSQLGVIFAGGLSGPKARMKLMVAMESTLDIATLKKLFA